MKVRDALNQSIREAVKDGRIDRKKHGALIEAARKLATMMDDPDWPIVRGKLDNVSPTVFLKYCEKLGLDVDAPPKAKKVEDEIAVKDHGGRIVGMSKWKKKA